MLLFVLWTILVLGALAGAGYSHYRYRVTHNQYYERLFAFDEQAAGTETGCGVQRPNIVPALTLVTVCLLVPMSLVI